MNNKFKYTDEVDMSFGLAGMAISLTVWDKHMMISQITLDPAEGESSISFGPEFFFSNNPRMSARIAWNELVRQYQMFTGMVVGNIICRTAVNKHQRLSQQLAADIYALVHDEGRDMCELEDDEINAIFKKTYNYLADIFADRQLASAADRFASDLRQRRTMSAHDIDDELRALRLQ